ncbi:hypothetical protein PR048_001743 [Dryococelus australis]|uniref:DUF4371 domain-containing protein n=1 Tax=Dryococelus australis TaxID=614101 RepID=A0ABQ9IID5_9NEOP|nr:hypothetical protein PR048_001743 [Dryococelus australis]
MFKNPKGDCEASVRVSYAIAELIAKLIAKNCKYYSDSEFVKQCLVKTAEIVCFEKVKNFRNISLSRNTIAERVDDITHNLNEQLLVKAKSFVAFSIAVDESTDVSGKAQVSVFIRACDKYLNIIEELLRIVSLQNTTTVEDIFEEVYRLLERFNLPLSKLVCVATHGAPSMMGKHNGFIARLLVKQKEVFPESKLHHIHCIIHQEVLCSKTVQMEHILKYVKKEVNFICSQGLNRQEIRLFLEMKCESVDQQCDDNWLRDLKFMVDMTGHLNYLNLKQQRKDELAFKLKLNLWEGQLNGGQLNGGNLIHFPTCQDLRKSHSASDFSPYTFNLNEPISEFESRFEDFKTSENYFSLFCDPFSFDVQ